MMSIFLGTMADNKLNIPPNLYNQLDNSPSFFVLRVGMDGCYTYVNKAFAEKFSFISPQLIGKPYEVTIHPDDLESCMEATHTCIANPEKSIPVRLRKPTPDGGFSMAFYEFSALQNAQGEVTEILCIGYDITETEVAHQEARLNSNKFDVIIENITDACYLLDKNWRMIKVNRAFEKLVGRPREEMIGKNIWEEYPSPETVEYLKRMYKKALEENKSIRFEEHQRYLNKWLERTVYPSQEGLTILVRDITERKQTEERILDANNKLIAALNSTSDLNILLSPDFTILSFNKVAAEFAHTFFNSTIKEGDSFWQYAPPGTEQMFRESVSKALSREKVERKQIFSFAPGVELWYRLRFYPVMDADNNLIGVAFNATNIDKEQRQLENLEEIASLYSMEVRRPVATIMGITRLINEDDLNSQNKQWFGYLITTTQELDRVINRIVKKSNEIG